MKKSIIIIFVGVCIVLLATFWISYKITSDNESNNNSENIVQNNLTENTDKVEEISADVEINEYKDINIDSELAREIFEFVPKYLQTIQNKMTNEYMIYSAICKLEESQASSDTYMIDGGEFSGYKSDIVQKKVNELFGSDIVIEKKNKYDLPIGYGSDEDVFCKYPMGFGSSEEFQVIKELKENDKTYKLTVYALNIEYDIENLNHVYISTKDTFKLYKSQNTNADTIRQSMKEYTLSGIDLDPEVIVNEYKNELPLIEYELEKLDDRGTEYFVKDIKFNIE
jgi:hypothetical protein